MNKIIDNQLKRNDCGISAAKIVCNLLEVDVSRDIIEDSIYLDEEGASLESLNQFFQKYGFDSNFKLFDFNSINEDINETNKMFPCIVPVKKSKGLHYVVVNKYRNKKFEIFNPSESRPYKLSVNEFKNTVYYSASYVKFVDIEENLRVQIKNELNTRDIKVDTTISTHTELTEMYNKLLYFSYVESNFGFKNKKAGKAFLEDLLFNQEMHHIPKHFEEFQLKKTKIKINTPVFLSIKKTEESKAIQGRTIKNVYWRLFRTVGTVQNLWYIFLATSVLASFIGYISVFINQILIDHVLPSYQLNTLRIFAIGVGAFYLVDKSFRIYKKFVSIHLSNSFDRFFMTMFDKKLSDYSIRYIQGYKRGDLTERLSDTMKLKSFFTRYFSSIMVNLLIATSSLVFLFAINWQLSLLVVAVLILFAALFYILTPIIASLERQRYTKKATFMSKFIEKIDGIQAIKALGLESYSSKQILSSMEELIKVQTKSKYVGMANSVVSSLITAFASLSLLFLASRELILYNSITLGMIITFLALSSKIFSAFGSLLDKNLSLQEHKVILSRFFDFDEHKVDPAILETAANVSKHGKREIEKSNTLRFNKITDFSYETLRLHDVSFTYNDIKFILNNIEIEVNKGDKIIITGKNGSGKSTLCKILGMLYEPTSGQVFLNDVDISLYDKKKLRKKIVFVSSDDLLFNETFLFNVAFGRKIDLKLLIKYATALGIYDFINSKPEKFEFMVYENGKNLSTGQRKKVLLLRALMTEASLIILDEIFNGLDMESKQQAELLINDIEDKAFIIVSHMPAEKIKFDKRYNIENGILLEQST